MAKSKLEETLWLHIKAARLPMQREYRFDPVRRWRFDFADPAAKIAAECEGGIWTRGRHTRGAGFAADLDKYNAAASAGWRVYRFSRQHIESGDAMRTLEYAYWTQAHPSVAARG